MFPLAFGLATVAPTVVKTFLPVNWASVGTMLMFLAVLSAPRPLASVLIAHLYARRSPVSVVILEWTSLVLLLGSLATVGRVSPLWTCAVVGLVFVARTLAAMWFVEKLDGISASTLLLRLVRPFIACVIMSAAILAVRPAVSSWRPAAQLTAEVSLGAVVYLIAIRVVARRATAEATQLLRSALKRSHGSVA